MIESETRQANWRRANPRKYDAHLAVQKALKAGLLEKLTCEACGIDAVDAHHDRYELPLCVRWLCRRIMLACIIMERICFRCGRRPDPLHQT